VQISGRFTQDDRDFSRLHRNPHLHLHLFTYTAQVRSAGDSFAIAAGDVLLTPPDTELRFDIPTPGVHWCIRVEPGGGRGAAGGEGIITLRKHYRLGPQLVEVRQRIAQVCSDHLCGRGDQQHPASRAAAAGFQSLLCWLAAVDLARPERSRVEICLKKAETILASLECAGLPISTVAERVGMSQNRLAKAFHQRHAMTMAQYRCQQLMRHATWMMESTDLTLAQIRTRLEIHDAHHFNKLFRRMTGLSPRAWLQARQPVLTSSPRPKIPVRTPGG
jgi:AraC-like DNA-binding protein